MKEQGQVTLKREDITKIVVQHLGRNGIIPQNADCCTFAPTNLEITVTWGDKGVAVADKGKACSTCGVTVGHGVAHGVAGVEWDLGDPDGKETLCFHCFLARRVKRLWPEE